MTLLWVFLSSHWGEKLTFASSFGRGCQQSISLLITVRECPCSLNMFEIEKDRSAQWVTLMWYRELCEDIIQPTIREHLPHLVKMTGFCTRITNLCSHTSPQELHVKVCNTLKRAEITVWVPREYMRMGKKFFKRQIFLDFWAYKKNMEKNMGEKAWLVCDYGN